ncbi:MAG: hypothetical protein ISQ86_12550 [Alphaproteobacteria bacterium]|nr:hypothetical protein [Alphaproteobacteria bacterium]
MRYVTRLQLLLGGICFLLLGVLAYEWMIPPAKATVPALRGRTRVAVPPLPLANPSLPIEAFDVINARPLFKPDRKPVPPPPTPAEAAAAPPPPPTLSLVGVIIDGSRQLALLRVPQSPLAVSASVGDDVAGWRVTAVYPDHIVLRRDTTEMAFSLNSNRPSDLADDQAPPDRAKPPAPSPGGISNEQKP